MQSSNDLIITGIPRSGTTLLSTLVNNLEDTVCLNEPTEFFERAQTLTKQEYLHFVKNSFIDLRKKLSTGEKVLSKLEGKTNFFNKDRSKVKVTFSKVSKNLSENFLLGIKHNAPFISVLPELANDFKVLGILRHPIPTILSWLSVDFPISKGNLPAAALWTELKEVCESNLDVIQKQVTIYDMFCERFWNLKEHPNVTLMRYEDLLEDDSLVNKLLAKQSVRITSIDREVNNYYPWDKSDIIKEYLKKYAPNSKRFYPELEIYD